MRFMLTLSIAATTALMAAWAADAQSIPLTITPTPADAQAIPAQGPGQIFLAAPDKDSSWRGLVWPSLTGGGLERLSLANGDGLRATDGRSLFASRFGDAQGFEQLTRLAGDWPGALRFKTGAFGFDLTPHASVSTSNVRDAQDAGAVLRFGRGLGLSDAEAGRRGKWFLFASTDQQTLGMGFLRNEDPWRRFGLGSDPGAVIEDTRAGVAWRDGPFEASVGYLYREIKPRDLDMIDAQSSRESMVAFRLSFHPGKR